MVEPKPIHRGRFRFGWQVMTWILSNWVERRASQEDHLKNAIDVWLKAQGAILQATESLRKHYGNVASIRFIEKSMNRMALEITSSRESTPARKTEETKTTVLLLEFVPEVPQIVVSSDRGKHQRFPIEADCDHAFINLCGREILFDEFSKCVLEEAFFDATTRPVDRKNESERALEYINELVRNYDAQQDGTSGRTR